MLGGMDWSTADFAWLTKTLDPNLTKCDFSLSNLLANTEQSDNF